MIKAYTFTLLESFPKFEAKPPNSCSFTHNRAKKNMTVLRLLGFCWEKKGDFSTKAPSPRCQQALNHFRMLLNRWIQLRACEPGKVQEDGSQDLIALVAPTKLWCLNWKWNCAPSRLCNHISARIMSRTSALAATRSAKLKWLGASLSFLPKCSRWSLKHCDLNSQTTLFHNENKRFAELF